MEDYSRRPLPHNKEAEASVLASCLLNEEIAGRVLPTLRKDDFYDLRHQSILVAMQHLNRKGRGVDPITLKDYLASKKSKVEALEIVKIADNTFSLVQWDSHLEIVKRCSLQRKLIRTCTGIIAMAYDPQEDIESVRMQAIDEIMALVADKPAEDGEAK